MILSRDFYNRPTLDVARDLLGKLLVHHTSAGRVSGLIVEVEAYIGESDPACHAAPGRTRRNAPLYGPPGIAYVYLNYGMHYLVNAVTEPVDAPAAVLIRALEPREGIDVMRRRRARGTGRRATSFDVHELCRGPGNLTKALGITLRDNTTDLCGTRLFIEDAGVTVRDSAVDLIDVPAAADGRGRGARGVGGSEWHAAAGGNVPARTEPAAPLVVAWSERIGISVGTEHHWRCFVHGHPCVSGRAALTGRRPRTAGTAQSA